MSFAVLQEVKNQSVTLWDSDTLARAVVPREVLKDAAGIPGDVDLDNEKLLLLASANVAVLGRVASRKLEAGELMPSEPGGRCVLVTAGDIRGAGEKLSASVVYAPGFAWGLEIKASRPQT